MDPSNAMEGRYLIRRLPEFNPWWEDPTEGTVTEDFDSVRSSFYDIHQAVVTTDSGVIPVLGMDGVGKTTLLKQLISALIDSDFVEKFYRTPEFRSEARSGVVPTEQVLYIPFDEDALCQLQPATQLESAITYWETHYARPQSDSARQYILLDDIETLFGKAGSEPPNQFQNTLTNLLEDHPERRIIVTATPGVIDGFKTQLRNRMPEPEGSAENSPTHLLPIPFGDFLRGRFKEIQTASDEHRFHRARAREAFHQAAKSGDHTVLIDQLRTEIDTSAIPAADMHRELTHYLTIGGYLGQRLVYQDDSRDYQFDSVLRGQTDPDINAIQQGVRDSISRMLRIRAPEFGVRDSPSKLIQLAALVATEHPSTAIQFTDLTDILSVDRRTLRDSFLPVVSRLQLVTPAAEYANRRPRAFRLYHRDTGIANAFANRDLNDILRADQQLEAALTKSVLFDHTVRLSTTLNDPRDPKSGIVKYWAGDDGEIDFIPKINGRPIPIYWSGQKRLSELVAASDPPGGFQALVAFLQSDESESERDAIDPSGGQPRLDGHEQSRRHYIESDDYHGELNGGYVGDGDPPFGIVLTAAPNNQAPPIRSENPDSLAVPLVEIPQWAYLRMI